MAGNLHRIDRHRPKIFLNPNFLAYSSSPWKGTNMYTWFYELNKSWEKVPAFLKSHLGSTKNKKLQEITVSVFHCTFELTAWLLKSFHRRLHCYTLSPSSLSGADFEIIPTNNILAAHHLWAGSLHFPPRAGCFFHGRQVRPEKWEATRPIPWYQDRACVTKQRRDTRLES